jgi:hypothetical protein
MERIIYDPEEIDPSIREAEEAAARERELSARIRLEIERYVADNDLVPRSEVGTAPIPPPWESDETDEFEARPKTKREAKEEARWVKNEVREARREQRAAGAAKRRKAVSGVFTGSILGSEWMREMWVYLLLLIVVAVGYIAYNFHVQSLQLDRQALEAEVRELGADAVKRTAERVRQTSRSAIVERLNEKEIPLEEFSNPVKRIER